MCSGITGAGKTLEVIAPFLFMHSRGYAAPARLIYALPLRTLVNSIYKDAITLAEKLGLAIEAELDAPGREIVSPFVTMQTDELPDDKFFDRGRLVVTTYDQLLRGLLGAPFGLSDRLHNINAAAIAGCLVVFDEFHLMEPSRAFLTSAALLNLLQ